MTETFFRHKNGLKHINVVDLNIADNDGFSALFVVNTPIVDNSGVAHGVEHMVFRGSTAFPQPETLFQLISLTDAKINASTFTETTYFHCQSQCEHTFSLAINYLLNGLFDPTFNDNDLHCEIHNGGDKGVIYRELLGAERLSENNPFSEDKTEFYYGGLSTLIGELTRYDLRDFHQRFYHANNITLVTANADIDKISHFISLLPEPENQSKNEQVSLKKFPLKTKNNKASSDKEQAQKKYSLAINKLITLYHLYSEEPSHQQIKHDKKIERVDKNLLTNSYILLEPCVNNLISPLVTLSNKLLANRQINESINVNEISTTSKISPLPNLLSKLFKKIEKSLMTNKANHPINQAYSYDQHNLLWAIDIGINEKALATIASYIISAYPPFLSPRCQGSCYAIQALTIENSAYLTIYSAFDVSPATSMKKVSLSLFALSQDNHFISACLLLAKMKYCHIHQTQQNTLNYITSLHIADYLRAIANGPHPKV